MSTRTHAHMLDYAIVDVFAERPFEGNSLAVIGDGRGLSDTQMQAIARETNLSETTFVLPADKPAQDAEQGVRVRIFTTREELPFAGHPTLGTASWLFRNHPTLAGQETITLALNAGLVPVRFRRPEPGEFPAPGDFSTMQQPKAWLGPQLPRTEVANALGLDAGDLEPGLQAQVISTGMPFCIVVLKSLAALSRLQIPQAVATRYLASIGAKFFYCLAPASSSPQEPVFRARMQFYGGEDPATGSAAGCAAVYLVRWGLAASQQPVVIEQGGEVERPSRIHVEATLRDGVATGVFVGGRTIPVATGRFFLP